MLPDTLLAATLLFSLLFQSLAIATFTVCLIIHAGLHTVFAGFLGRNVQGLRRPMVSGACSGRFPGSSYLRAASGNNNSMTDSGWPSYYASFMGFFMAYLGSLTIIYKAELAASPQRSISTTGGLVVAAIVLLMCILYRLSSGCDDVFGVLAGVAIGGILGFTFVNVLAYASNRSLTNVLALPLLMNTAADGKPIYVCAPKRS